MKFICFEGDQQKEDRLKLEKPNLFEDHKYFLWFPRKMEDGYCHWLEFVYRRVVYIWNGKLEYHYTLLDNKK